MLFGPFDLPIVIGDPSKRRTFMDEAVIALWPLKEGLFTAYDRSLRQRNRLLKEWEGSGTPPGLEAWDEELIQAGSAVMRARAEAIERLAPHASDEFVHLAGYELAVHVRTQRLGTPPTTSEQAYRDRIAERRRDELQRRTSLVGPHRDDLTLAVRDLGARAAGSHGETWATALCLRAGLATAVTEGARRAAGVAGGRPVQRARSHAPRPDRRAPRLAPGPGVHLGGRRGRRARPRRTPCGTCAPAP